MLIHQNFNKKVVVAIHKYEWGTVSKNKTVSGPQRLRFRVDVGITLEKKKRYRVGGA